MTNQFRLKILGIGLMIAALGAFLLLGFLPDPGVHPDASPMVLNSLMFGVLVLPIIGLACYARGKGRSVFWGAMGLLPFVGPVFGLAAITVDDLLSKLSAPKLVRRLATSVVAVSGPAVILAIVIPTYLQIQAKSHQSEARIHLREIFDAETAFWFEFVRYGTFDEVGFTLDGHSTRYTYRIDNSGKPGTVFPAKNGAFTPENTVVHAGVSADGRHFTATATANIDLDATIDQWHISDSQPYPVHDVDDRKL